MSAALAAERRTKREPQTDTLPSTPFNATRTHAKLLWCPRRGPRGGMKVNVMACNLPQPHQAVCVVRVGYLNAVIQM
jgi:hypothetical protein